MGYKWNRLWRSQTWKNLITIVHCILLHFSLSLSLMTLLNFFFVIIIFILYFDYCFLFFTKYINYCPRFNALFIFSVESWGCLLHDFFKCIYSTIKHPLQSFKCVTELSKWSPKTNVFKWRGPICAVVTFWTFLLNKLLQI